MKISYISCTVTLYFTQAHEFAPDRLIVLHPWNFIFSCQLLPDTEKLHYPPCLSNRYLRCLPCSLFTKHQYSSYM